MTIDFKLPELGENIESGDVVNVLVREGDQIAANDGVIELETDKAVVEIPCRHAGRVTKIHVKKGDTVKVGQVLVTIEGAEKPAQAPKEQPKGEGRRGKGEERTEKGEGTPTEPQAAIEEKRAATPTRETSPEAAAGLVPAGPAARRVARELGVDLQSVRGSGKHGRITPEDVQAAGKPAGPTGPAFEPVAPPGESGQDSWGPVRRDRISRIRRTIAEQMVRSATTIPHVTNFDDADVTDLERLRQGVPEGYLGEGIKLTLMPLLIKAVATALRRHPMLNASLDETGEQIVYKEYVNMGIAVDTPRGLVVPNIRNADRMTVRQLAAALATIAKRARAAEFAVEDLRGGTFTISNLGAVGGTYSTPIINHPEVAILLVGRGRWMPVARGENHDRIETRLMLPLSLSFDHRLVDGAAAGRFLNDVIQYLQTPAMLLL